MRQDDKPEEDETVIAAEAGKSGTQNGFSKWGEGRIENQAENQPLRCDKILVTSLAVWSTMGTSRA